MNEQTRYLTDGTRQFSSILQAFEACLTIEQVRAAVYQEIAAGLRLYWNSARLEVKKDDLPLDEFAY